MNHRLYISLLAAGTLAACGQPPSPVTPRAVPQAQVTTTTITTTPTTAHVHTPAPPTTTTPPPKPPPPPPPPPKTTVKPPPPPPKPPNRLVVTDTLRKSLEERDGLPFPGVWEGMQGELNGLCPAKAPCVGHALVVDTSTGSTEDCVIVDKGIKVPDPLYEGGKITFRVTSTRCSEG